MSNKKEIDHSARKHALLSASGASRWMACTPSPQLESKFENTTSSYAEEGTLAHEFAEINLKLQLDIISKEEYEIIAEPFRQNKYYSDEMEYEVQKHVDYVIEQYNEARRITKDAIISIEDKVDLTEFIEEGFGTCDDIIIADGTLEVIDLKYGKGVRVSAEENKQLMLYGLGALIANELMYDITNVKLTIVQPRLDSISTWDISAEDLRNWGENEVKPKAKMAFAGEGELVAGDHCKFCKVKAKCRALAEDSMKIAQEEFKDPNVLTDKELLEMFSKFPRVLDWIKSVNSHILSEALDGKKWDGYKLVAGRSNRTWSDQEKAEEILKKKRFKKADYLSKPKLLGITAIEKLVGKDDFYKMMNTVVVKPPGKPTLVDSSDKREEFVVSNAKDDFSDTED